MRKTLLARSSATRVTDEVSMIDLPTDGSLPDGAFNDDHLGTLDAVRGAVHPISKGSRSRSLVVTVSEERKARTTGTALGSPLRGIRKLTGNMPRTGARSS